MKFDLLSNLESSLRTCCYCQRMRRIRLMLYIGRQWYCSVRCYNKKGT